MPERSTFVLSGLLLPLLPIALSSLNCPVRVYCADYYFPNVFARVYSVSQSKSLILLKTPATTTTVDHYEKEGGGNGEGASRLRGSASVHRFASQCNEQLSVQKGNSTHWKTME